jgi:hypothetical protein
MASRGGLDPVDGHGEELRYWDVDRSLSEMLGDYKLELSGSETNLRSYFKLNNDFDDIGSDNNDGSGSGSYSFSGDVPFISSSENIKVDVWDGDSWENVFGGLSDGWNNVSVTTYLINSTFTIRFKDDISFGDSIQDSWNIDATLLHIWGGQEVVEVEFIGSSNAENWSRLRWQIESSWNESSVGVTLQLYDFNSSIYPTSGNGFISYTSDAIPGTDEWLNQTITLNPEFFRNSSGHWKIKIRGVKSTTNKIEGNVDWIQFKPRFECPANNILYGEWQEYRIRGLTTEGEPISYAYTSIFNNGTFVQTQDAITKAILTNPDWVYLDEQGEYYLEIKSTNGTTDTFFLKVIIGSVIGEKTITQQPP